MKLYETPNNNKIAIFPPAYCVHLYMAVKGLIYMRKRRRPKIHPRGTPSFINAQAEAEPGSTKIVSAYDQEIPQSQTPDNPVSPRGRAAQPSRDTRKTN